MNWIWNIREIKEQRMLQVFGPEQQVDWKLQNTWKHRGEKRGEKRRKGERKGEERGGERSRGEGREGRKR